MAQRVKLVILLVSLSFVLAPCAQAKLNRFTYPYDISQLEWQLLNWTAAWRGTATPGGPFTLERMEYQRKERKVHIYLTGNTELGTEANFKKAIENITSTFKGSFPDFEPQEDLTAHFNLASEKENKSSYLEYNNGSFSNEEKPLVQPSPGMGY